MKCARRVLTVVALTWLASAAAVSSTIDDFEYMSVTAMCDMLPDDTSFLRPNTCNYWVRCGSNGSSLEEGACATGLYYNKEVGRCALASSVNCPYFDAQSSANRCATQTDGTFLADPSSSGCSGYILCKSHKEIYSNCPNNLVFSPTIKACVYPDQYRCPISNGTKTTPVCRSLPNNTRIADEQYCNKYYTCTKDILHEHECSAQMAYDAARGRCVSVNEVSCYGNAALPAPENTFCLNNGTGKAREGYFADDESCSHYYICGSPVNGKHDTEPQHLECGLQQYFDYEKLSCRDRLNVKCLLDRCAGTDLTYVNVAHDCQNYARCSGGKTVGTGRCPDNYYFDEKAQGCTPTKHNYIACST